MMAGIKQAVAFILGGTLASLWWAAARWGYFLWLLAGLATFATIIVGGQWTINRWDEEKK